MPDYEKLYFTLFSTLAEVVEQIDKYNFGTARELLIKAQRQAEEQYISCEEAE